MLTYDIQVTLAKKVYETFANNELDAIITPGFGFPAPKSGSVAKLQYTFSYTAGWNALHYPSGSVPVSVVREN